jgi:hypothetical protein
MKARSSQFAAGTSLAFATEDYHNIQPNYIPPNAKFCQVHELAPSKQHPQLELPADVLELQLAEDGIENRHTD